MSLFETFLNSPLRLKIADFLNINLVYTKFSILNMWWLLHIFSSVLATMVLIRTKLSRKMIFILVVSGAIIYEIIEWFAYTKWIPILFIPEVGIDIVWDIIASMIGIGLVFWFAEK